MLRGLFNVMIVFGSAISLLGCQGVEPSDCVVVDDQALKARLIETIRPLEEFHRDFDDFTYTMEMHLESFDMEVLGCRAVYVVTFTPSDGYVGWSTEYTISKIPLEIVHMEVF